MAGVKKKKSNLYHKWGLANPGMYYSYENYGLCWYKCCYDFRVYEDIVGFFDELTSMGLGYEKLPMEIRYWYDYLIYEYTHPEVDEEYKDMILKFCAVKLRKMVVDKYYIGDEFSVAKMGELSDIIKDYKQDNNWLISVADDISDFWLL